jgi:DNA-binding response OmpR family regulator
VRRLFDWNSSLLLGDRDPIHAGKLALELSTRGFDPTLAFEPEQLFKLLDATEFDLVALAPSIVEIDDTNGPEIVRSVRERTDAPLLAIARADWFSTLFERGVESVLPSEASLPEVGAAAHALLRFRGGRQLEATRWGPLVLDQSRRSARWHGAPVNLTKLQFRLLSALVAAEGAVVTREELNRAVYGSAPTDDGERIVAHVRRIRDKLESDSSHPTFLLTVRGEGFRLADPDLTDSSSDRSRSA